MSQARVTDFFAQRKKGVAAPVKADKRSAAVHHRGTRARRSKVQEESFCPDSVHEEFLRVIDEASRVDESASTDDLKDASPASPRTPKRTSEEFDLSGFSATVEYCTAKKMRQDAAPPPRRTARKKLVLPLPPSLTGKVTAAPTKDQASLAAQTTVTAGPDPHTHVSKQKTKRTFKKLSKDELDTLKSRLQKIKQHAEDASALTPAPSSPPKPVAASSDAADAGAAALLANLTRARELAAKAERRKEAQEMEEQHKPSQTTSQESVQPPGYQRYHTLAQAAPPGLSLPYQYKLLAEMFRSMDTVVAMLHNRSETATFTKIKQGVQDMMHKRFEETHVGQIRTVFPEAYTFRQEKNVPSFSSSSTQRGSYQLTMEPILQSDKNEARPLLSASRLLERRHIFHQNLVSLVKQHHQVFLSSLVPPVSVPEDKLTRWHPRFNVDTVPPVQVGSLPQPPQTEKLSTAQEVLDKARSLITPKMEKALISVAQKTKGAAAAEESSQDPATHQTSTPAPDPTTQVPTALRGVPQTLLDRIRAKEAQKLQAAMTRNPEQEGRLVMISRLGELARILRTVFVAEKKPALIMEVLCNRMVSSYRSALSTGEMEKHVRLLAELVPDWLTILPVRKDFYVKVNRNTEVSLVLEQLSRRQREEERV
ncbi:DNA replication factor Cdt1 isoform 2-T2 [Synchiropus picturatus]